MYETAFGIEKPNISILNKKIEKELTKLINSDRKLVLQIVSAIYDNDDLVVYYLDFLWVSSIIDKYNFIKEERDDYVKYYSESEIVSNEDYRNIIFFFETYSHHTSLYNKYHNRIGYIEIGDNWHPDDFIKYGNPYEFNIGIDNPTIIF